jgi:hypothetical protein
LVDDAEFDGIANFEVEIGADAQDGSSSGDISGAEGSSGASGLVVEGVPRGLSSGAGTARLLIG